MIQNKLDHALAGSVIFSLGLDGYSLFTMRREVLLKTRVKNDRLAFLIIPFSLSLRNYYV